MASHKKVVVRQLDDTLAWGYLPSSGFLEDGLVQLLDTAGKVLPIELRQVKMICFVRDFNLADSQNPERLGRTQFLGKPRGEGLWLRLRLVNDNLEGLAQFDSVFLDHLIEDRCVLLTPPDPKSNCYLMLIPRTAVTDIEVVGSVGHAAKRKQKVSEGTAQSTLFSEG